MQASKDDILLLFTNRVEIRHRPGFRLGSVKIQNGHVLGRLDQNENYQIKN